MTANYNIYTFIHKYLRQQLCQSVINIGCLDDSDDGEVRNCLYQVSTQLDFCQSHLDNENRFIHTAIQARNPNMYLTTEAEHREHEVTIRKLKKDIQSILESSGARRSALLHTLYLELSLFLAENLEHMHTEETHNARLLSDLFTQTEIDHIHENIVASISPERRLRITGDMLCALMHTERLSLLLEMQQHMPEPVFMKLIVQLNSILSAAHFGKLQQGLGHLLIGESQIA